MAYLASMSLDVSFFNFIWHANDQARIWPVSTLISSLASPEDRRQNPSLVPTTLVSDMPSSTIPDNMIGDIWLELIVKARGS